ncbi:MAG: ribbon-helix-helix domain-containing protein [Burkholderiales bacterium]|nr:ribbon-helix-helix domain-containing protein [Burkholderiales bacterium]
METDELVRWTVKVSKDTDVSLRSFLAQRGTKKGDLSKFIEQAVQKEVFAQTVANVQARNAEKSDKEIDDAINDALRHVRAELWGSSVKKSAAKKKKI